MPFLFYRKDLVTLKRESISPSEKNEELSAPHS